MIPIKELFEKPTDQNRRQFWHKRMEECMENVKDKVKYITSEHVKMLENEIIGGDCTRCGRPFKRILVDNKIALGEYYQPSCWCFKYCQNCKKSLFDEELAGNKMIERGVCPECRKTL